MLPWGYRTVPSIWTICITPNHHGSTIPVDQFLTNLWKSWACEREKFTCQVIFLGLGSNHGPAVTRTLQLFNWLTPLQWEMGGKRMPACPERDKQLRVFCSRALPTPVSLRHLRVMRVEIRKVQERSFGAPGRLRQGPCFPRSKGQILFWAPYFFLCLFTWLEPELISCLLSFCSLSE